MKRALSFGCRAVAVVALGLVSSCVMEVGDESAEVGERREGLTSARNQHIFVIAMENHDSNQIYGNTTHAPYINNTLIPNGARATNFNDELALSIPSEPHYVWMEAGTNAFSDRTFTGDGDPSSSNSTSNTSHLVTQIKNATNGVTWRTYQEGLNSSTGRCPIRSSGFYAAKHNPFVFFKDVAGNPPSTTNAYCIDHHRAYSSLAADLEADDVASFTFITPNQCHDMHGQSGCSDSNTVRAGDTWLRNELPRILDYADEHAGVVFITWDEGSSTLKMPFLALGPSIKTNYAGGVSYNHSSVLKSIEVMLGLPTLSRVASATELSDLFKSGQYP